MSRSLRRAAALVFATLAVSILAGCGGKTIVHIDGTTNTISAPALDHWMRALVGSDFRETIGAEGPEGLVAEPVDHHRCFNAAKLVAPRSFFNQLRPSKATLEERCDELYRAVKQQALHFLISVQWADIEAAQRHLGISDADLHKELGKIRKTRFPSEPELRRYLTERQWSLSDLLYRLRYEMLERRLWPQSITVADEFGGRPGYEKVQTEQQARLTAKTKCERGYVVPGCSSYHRAGSSLPNPNSIISQLVNSNN
jgi:hypothetical protein